MVAIGNRDKTAKLLVDIKKNVKESLLKPTPLYQKNVDTITEDILEKQKQRFADNLMQNRKTVRTSKVLDKQQFEQLKKIGNEIIEVNEYFKQARNKTILQEALGNNTSVEWFLMPLQLYNSANERLSNIKADGTYTPKLPIDEEIKRRKSMLQDFHKAIKENALFLQGYQSRINKDDKSPINNITTNVSNQIKKTLSPINHPLKTAVKNFVIKIANALGVSKHWTVEKESSGSFLEEIVKAIHTPIDKEMQKNSEFDLSYVNPPAKNNIPPKPEIAQKSKLPSVIQNRPLPPLPPQSSPPTIPPPPPPIPPRPDLTEQNSSQPATRSYQSPKIVKGMTEKAVGARIATIMDTLKQVISQPQKEGTPTHLEQFRKRKAKEKNDPSRNR